MTPLTLFRSLRVEGDLADVVEARAPYNPLPLHPNSLTTAIGEAHTDSVRSGPISPLSNSQTCQAVGINLVTLGELRCTLNGVDTDLPKQKLRFALLVYLGMERSVPREKVAALFWPDIDEERVRRRLNQNIYAIRQALGTDCIETRGDDLRATPDLIVDAAEFGDLADDGKFERAVTLYRRPFLDGFYIDGADDWERWVDKKRDVFTRTYAHAARLCINALIEKRDYDRAIEHTTRWLELDENNEDPHLLMMIALARDGQPNDAIAHYTAWERDRRQSGIPLSEKSKQLLLDIKAGAIAPLPPAPPSLVSEAHAVAGDSESENDYKPDRKTDRVVPRLGLVGALIATLMLVAVGGYFFVGTLAISNADPSRFAVIPFHYHDPRHSNVIGEHQLRDALATLTDLSVADYWQVQSAVSIEGGNRRPSDPLSLKSAGAVARRTGAGRMMLAEVTSLRGDSVRIQVTMFDVRYRRPKSLRSITRRLRADSREAEVVLADMVRRLLFDNADAKALVAAEGGTSSYVAMTEFVRGEKAIAMWALPAAESAFFAATRVDVGFAKAALWLAQTRMWMEKSPAEWRSVIEIAAAKQDNFNPRDKLLIQGLVALAKGDRTLACGLYKKLTEIEVSDFTGWYSYGLCLASDDIVVRDDASPTGWRFRSGYQSAVNALTTAFELAPGVHRGLADDLFSRLRRLLLTSETAVRLGRALPPDSTRFSGAIYWSAGDTLGILPIALSDAAMGQAPLAPPTKTQATRRQRELFLSIARGWRASFQPTSATLVALAVGLDLNGDASAADTLAYARRLATSDMEREALAAYEVILRLKHNVPYEVEKLKSTMLLADSIMRIYPPSRTNQPQLMAALAAMRGRPDAVIEYRARSKETLRAPSQVISVIKRLETYASFGDPADSIRFLARVLNAEMLKIPDPAERTLVASHLRRASALAFPTVRQDLTSTTPNRVYFVDAQRAFLRSDTQAVIGILNRVQDSRRKANQKVGIDGALIEASLLSDVGRLNAAADLLDSALWALSSNSPTSLNDAVFIASVIRAMKLRADIANRLGDRASARLWSAAVEVLWDSRLVTVARKQ